MCEEVEETVGVGAKSRTIRSSCSLVKFLCKKNRKSSNDLVWGRKEHPEFALVLEAQKVSHRTSS